MHTSDAAKHMPLASLNILIQISAIYFATYTLPYFLMFLFLLTFLAVVAVVVAMSAW
jgi:hypothetical protein